MIDRADPVRAQFRVASTAPILSSLKHWRSPKIGAPTLLMAFNSTEIGPVILVALLYNHRGLIREAQIHEPGARFNLSALRITTNQRVSLENLEHSGKFNLWFKSSGSQFDSLNSSRCGFTRFGFSLSLSLSTGLPFKSIK